MKLILWGGSGRSKEDAFNRLGMLSPALISVTSAPRSESVNRDLSSTSGVSQVSIIILFIFFCDCLVLNYLFKIIPWRCGLIMFYFIVIDNHAIRR